ncbi:hypothetical protein J8273_7371 [Carpediemonas membranifera]|uniref:Uncharacterized protein n=1 Tax=Carpediemonas membranifera TaxID=201153 RepID=A0A8J6B1M8_9EUKA|nr:hypothetical protein J8273_7371 [Carpediemonas membranifera]|eukprot:KAG9391097.1 hypothetical protein J8273_7371 [Carpediemonas membranifera]
MFARRTLMPGGKILRILKVRMPIQLKTSNDAASFLMARSQSSMLENTTNTNSVHFTQQSRATPQPRLNSARKQPKPTPSNPLPFSSADFSPARHQPIHHPSPASPALYSTTAPLEPPAPLSVAVTNQHRGLTISQKWPNVERIDLRDAISPHETIRFKKDSRMTAGPLAVDIVPFREVDVMPEVRGKQPPRRGPQSTAAIAHLAYGR